MALNKKTGELIWQSKEFTDSIHYSSPIVVEIGGVRQYVQLTDASVAGVAAADGRLLWRAARPRLDGRSIPTPIYTDGAVYVSSGYGAGCNLFKIASADGKFTAEPVYDNKVDDQSPRRRHPSRAKVPLTGSRKAKAGPAREFDTGKAVWQEKGKLGKGSIAYADGMLYLRAEDGKGTVRPHRGHARGLSREGPLRPARPQQQEQLAAPGGGRRTVVPPRPGRATVLRRTRQVIGRARRIAKPRNTSRCDMNSLGICWRWLVLVVAATALAGSASGRAAEEPGGVSCGPTRRSALRRRTAWTSSWPPCSRRAPR